MLVPTHVLGLNVSYKAPLEVRTQMLETVALDAL